jgi:hypothetical protein
MENRIALDRFEKLHRPLENERRGVQVELGRSKAKLSRLEAKAGANKPQATFNPDGLRKRWPSLPLQTQREIVHSFLRKIVVAEDEIEFTYPFRDFSERTAKPQHVPHPTSSRTARESDQEEPLYVRLPKAGQLCARTGMTRSALNELILPSERNGFRPPVVSKSMRKRDGGKGTRLILWQSLRDHLASQP